ncbi:sniffer [Carabus blaptoides fortunei]
MQHSLDLSDIAKANANVHILEIDLKKYDAYDKLSKQVHDIVGEDGLNVLFNNAGVASKFTRLNLVKPEQLQDAFATNTIAPIMLSKALYPVLKKAATNNVDVPMGVRRAAIVNMSSILGSITANTDGGYYPYRCSKAALNMATKSLSVDLKADGILVTALHPGWVKTDMGGTRAPLEVSTSAGDIVHLLYTLTEHHNGAYVQHDGKPLHW